MRSSLATVCLLPLVLGIALAEPAPAGRTPVDDMASPESARPQPRPQSTDPLEAKIDALIEATDRAWHAGDYPECVRINEEIIALDPTWVDMYSTTAWLQWSMGQYLVALHTLHRGIAANPHSWEARFNMGLHRYNLKEYERAAKYLGQAVAMGGDKQARKTYAYALLADNKPAEALKVWRGLIHDFPTDPVVRNHWERAEAAARGK
jgi:tetratricopeptide (TPR) repeat protein